MAKIGVEMEKVLMDATLQQKVYEIVAHQQRVENEIVRIAELMDEIKPIFNSDAKYNLAETELDTQIASFDTFISNW